VSKRLEDSNLEVSLISFCLNSLFFKISLNNVTPHVDITNFTVYKSGCSSGDKKNAVKHGSFDPTKPVPETRPRDHRGYGRRVEIQLSRRKDSRELSIYTNRVSSGSRGWRALYNSILS
jgi:hypothetical protein